MISNIIVGIMCVVVIAAGIFGWWWENGGSYQDSKKEEDKSESEDNETEGIAEDVMFYHAARHAMDILGLKSGDNIILTGGQASKKSGSTNTIRLETIK